MLSEALKDGFGISVSFGTSTDVNLVIDPVSVNPPGIDGGDAIDTTTHSNSVYRTKTPRSLKEITDGSFRAAYDPDGWDDILAAINVNQAITFTYPDGASVVFYGYLRSFEPGDFVEGEQPEGEGVIVVTNDNEGTETAPDYTEGS